ncbi:MAG: FAD-binding oxidoreductase [Burkholderiales bacterium]|nr:FAD-binding oxidoreductase [Burkholderiales bacterium]
MSDSPAASGTREALLTRFVHALGPAGVLTETADMAPYAADWRGRVRAEPLAVLRPSTSAEVAAAVRICAQTRTPLVAQGGNTGQCAGAVASVARAQVIVSLSRLNRIRALDAQNDTITVEAGCVLARVQEAATAADRLFPLSLGAEGSCQIGGNLATNAGGTAVLRYGNARDLVLGLEVVLADGSMWDGLRALRKDNTGYDLKQLFLGSEGTLGVITAAVLKLFAAPKAACTALFSVSEPAAAVTMLNRFRARCGDRLTGFELMSRPCLDILFKQIARFRDPFPTRYPWYVLAELRDTHGADELRTMVESVLDAGMRERHVQDAIVARSQAQAEQLWRMREEIPEANRREAPWVRHDVAVPVSRIAEFIERASEALRARFPGIRIVAFGHVGDGNIHFNATAAADHDAEAFIARQHDVYALVHDLVMALGGSFSAEHGIGLVKVDQLARYKSPIELALMQRIKGALDPIGILNPGKVLPPS